MKILNKKLATIEQFIEYLDSLKFYPWSLKPKRVIMHHTSSPVESWQNSGSMLHYWNLYRSRGWKSGPHIFIAPNGVWLFTPLNKRGHTSSRFLDKDSIHIEIVGRYYESSPKDKDICRLMARVSMELVKKFNFSIFDFKPHNNYKGGENCSPHVGSAWISQIWKDNL